MKRLESWPAPRVSDAEMSDARKTRALEGPIYTPVHDCLREGKCFAVQQEQCFSRRSNVDDTKVSGVLVLILETQSMTHY